MYVTRICNINIYIYTDMTLYDTICFNNIYI